MLLPEREKWKLANAMPWKADGDDDGANISLEVVIPIRFFQEKKEEWKGNNGWVLVASGSLDSLLTPALPVEKMSWDVKFFIYLTAQVGVNFIPSFHSF